MPRSPRVVIASIPVTSVLASSATPRMSTRPDGRGNAFGMKRNASTSSTIPIGTLIKKMPRQTQYCVMTPPKIGPAIWPIGMTDENIPIPRSRSRPK